MADIVADVEVVDRQRRQRLRADLAEPLEQILGDLLAGLGMDLAVLRIDDVLGDVAAVELLLVDELLLDALLTHPLQDARRSEEHTSELQSLMRISYAFFCLKKNKKQD